jgi:hypothetical protein
VFLDKSAQSFEHRKMAVNIFQSFAQGSFRLERHDTSHHTSVIRTNNPILPQSLSFGVHSYFFISQHDAYSSRIGNDVRATWN